MSGVMRTSFDDTSNSPEVEILGGTSQTKIGNVSDSLKVSVSNTSLTTAETELATFVVNALDVASANNKSLLSLVNTSGSSVKVKIREIRIVNTQNTAVTGVIIDINLLRIVGHSAGTSLTPVAHDTADTLSSSVTARTGSTVTSEGTDVIRHWDMSSDEWGSGTSDVESFDHSISMIVPSYIPPPKTKPITLNANEGVTFKCITNTTTGKFDLVVLFTQE
jgi:hypothetical protein